MLAPHNIEKIDQRKLWCLYRYRSLLILPHFVNILFPLKTILYKSHTHVSYDAREVCLRSKRLIESAF